MYLLTNNKLFLILLIVTPFIYFENLYHEVDLPRFTYVSLLAIIWFITWFIQTKSKNITLNWNPLFLLIIFLLFIASVSFVWSKESMTYKAEIYFYASLVIVCFMSMQATYDEIIRFCRIASIATMACAVIGILQNFGFNLFDYKQVAPPASTFINRNYAVNFFELLLPVLIMLLVIAKNNKEAWLSALSISMVASYLVLTKSRGAYLSTFMTLLLVFIAIQLFPSFKKQIALISTLYKKQITIIVFVPFLLAFLPNKIFSPDIEETRFSAYFSENRTNNSISHRLNANINSLSLLKEKPLFGVGLGGFQENFRPYLQSNLAKNKINSDFIYLHNEPLQLFIELGVIGGTTLLLFFIFLFRYSYLNIKYASESGLNSGIKNDQEKILYIGFYIAIIASLTHSFFSFPYHQATSATFMALWVGFSLQFLSKKLTFTNIKKQQLIKIIMLIIVFAFMLASAQFYYKYVKSSYYMNKAINTKSCEQAKTYIILANDIYAKDYFSQSQGINLIAICPLDTKIQLNFAENVLQNNPTHPAALYLASLSHFKQGNYDLSYKRLQTLSFLYPYYANAYTLIGHIAVKQKAYTTAKSYYEHALKLAPENTEAKNVLLQLNKKGY